MKSLFQNATFQEGEQKHYYYKKSTSIYLNFTMEVMEDFRMLQERNVL